MASSRSSNSATTAQSDNRYSADSFATEQVATQEIRLAGASGRAVVSVLQDDAPGTFQWVEDYAEGLRLMADLIARQRSLEDFSQVAPPRESPFKAVLWSSPSIKAKMC